MLPLFDAVLLISLALQVIEGVSTYDAFETPMTAMENLVPVEHSGGDSCAFIFNQIPQRWVDNKLFRTLGELSFSVYLLYMAVIIGIRRISREDLIFTFDRFLLVLLLTYAVAALVTRYFERPAQKAVLRRLLPTRSRQATT